MVSLHKEQEREGAEELVLYMAPDRQWGVGRANALGRVRESQRAVVGEPGPGLVPVRARAVVQVPCMAPG